MEAISESEKKLEEWEIRCAKGQVRAAVGFDDEGCISGKCY